MDQSGFAQLSGYDIAIIGGLFTIIGGLIGAIAVIFSARLTAEKQQMYMASSSFRQAFIDSIIKLRAKKEDVYKILSDEVIARQKIAKVAFEPWVPISQIKAFNSAWDKHEHSIKSSAPGSLDKLPKESEEALSRIESILRYAKTKG